MKLRIFLLLLALSSVAAFSQSIQWKDQNIYGNLILTNLTPTTVPYLDGSRIVQSSATTPTELGFVHNVTSSLCGINQSCTETNKSISGSSNTLTNIPLSAFTNLGTTTTLLHGNAAGNPSFSAVSLTADVSGITPVANGGTGVNNLTSASVIIGAGTSAVTFVAPGTSGNVLTSNGSTWASTASAAGGSYSSSNALANGGLKSSVGSSALTITLTQADGSTAPNTGTAAVIVYFRNATAATGAFASVSQTSTLAITVNSSATLGQTSAMAAYVWVYALNDAGTMDLCVNGGDPFDDTNLVAATQISAAATSASVLYCASAHTGSKPIRLIGRCLETEATAGTWASNCTELDLNPIPKKAFVAEIDGGAIAVAATGTALTKGTVTSGNDHFWYRRDGRYMYSHLVYQQTVGSGAAGTGIYIVTLPSSLAIDNTTETKFLANSSNTASDNTAAMGVSFLPGSGHMADESDTIHGNCVPRMYSTTQVAFECDFNTTWAQWGVGNIQFNKIFGYTMDIGPIPIKGWWNYGP